MVKKEFILLATDKKSLTKTYGFIVDGKLAEKISVKYERFNGLSSFSNAFISFTAANQEAAAIALDGITESLLREGRVPRITVVAEADTPQEKVASATGYKYIKGNEYSVYHPNAVMMYERGLAPLKDQDYNEYDKQYRGYIGGLQSYIDTFLQEVKEKEAKNENRR